MDENSSEDALLPRKLYKYRSLNADYGTIKNGKFIPDKEYTEKIITDKKLHFSPAIEFNDPFDCNPPVEKIIYMRLYHYTSFLSFLKIWDLKEIVL